jgi:hypothetical protein
MLSRENPTFVQSLTDDSPGGAVFNASAGVKPLCFGVHLNLRIKLFGKGYQGEEGGVADQGR